MPCGAGARDVLILVFYGIFVFFLCVCSNFSSVTSPGRRGRPDGVDGPEKQCEVKTKRRNPPSTPIDRAIDRSCDEFPNIRKAYASIQRGSGRDPLIGCKEVREHGFTIRLGWFQLDSVGKKRVPKETDS